MSPILLVTLLACGPSSPDAAESTPDADGDGFKSAAAGGPDCRDQDSSVHPDADEICDGIDNNCDGLVDGSAAVDAPTWYVDVDGDGYAGALATVQSCARPPGTSATEDDCDDMDPTVHPAAAEVCDKVDQDCDGEIDEDAIGAWYDDLDMDGFGEPDSSAASCEAGPGQVRDHTDCDDADGDVNPAADERCDGIDNDCDDEIDEDGAVDPNYWHIDADGDGHGDPDQGVEACDAQSGTAATGDDCDDQDDDIFPGADERCDGVDQDCDGELDEQAVDAPSWYADTDQDGFGDAAVEVADCEAPAETVAEAGDCDDGDPEVHPDATEICEDGVDNDCSGDAGACALADAALGDTEVVARGEAADDNLGHAVAGAGDLDGDGWPELAVSAHLNDTGATNGGAVYVYSMGRSGGASVQSAAVIRGSTGADYLGASVAGVGDVDADGMDDLLVGANGSNAAATDSGAAYLFAGPLTGALEDGDALAVVRGAADRDYLGISVRGAGDVNGDGAADVLIGASNADNADTDAGAAYLFLGPLSGTLEATDANLVLTGVAASDTAGRGIAGPGDMDGDGLPDLAVGAHANSDAATHAGAIYVLLGPGTGTRSLGSAAVIRGEADSDYAGFAIAGAGDVDGDGRSDLLVGAYGHDASGGKNAGAAYLVLGPGTAESSLTGAAAIFEGEAVGDSAGYAVAGGGDANGDGSPDLLIGAYKADISGSDDGAVYTVFGPVSGSHSLADADAVFHGDSAKDTAGQALGGAGDVDLDGYDDFIVGAEDESTAASSAGAAYLVLGTGD